MKKRILLPLLASSVLLLGSCGLNPGTRSVSSAAPESSQASSSLEEAPVFTIAVSATDYYCGGEDLVLSYTAQSGVKATDTITYVIVTPGSVSGVITGDHFTAAHSGQVQIQGQIRGVLSTNVIDVHCHNYTEECSGNFSKLFEGMLNLGEAYDVGIYGDIVTLTGADGFLSMRQDGCLEVIGYQPVGHVTITAHGQPLYDGVYTIARTDFVSELITTLGDKITTEDTIPNDLLKEVTSFSFANRKGDMAGHLAIAYMENLESLDLSNDGLTDIGFLKNHGALTHLALAHNQISDLSPLSSGSVSSKKLTNLDLTDNKITSVQPLRTFVLMKSLHLAKNALVDLSYLSLMTKLGTLDLNDNPTIDPDKINYVSGMKDHLTYLAIGNCGLANAAFQSLRVLSKLTYLDVSGIPLSVADLVSSFASLDTLILRGCGVTIDGLNALNNFKLLTHIDLSENHFSRASFFNASNEFIFHDIDKETHLCSSLVELDLEGEDFIDLPDFSPLVALKKMSLANNLSLKSIQDCYNPAVGIVNGQTPWKGLPLEELSIDNCPSISLGGDGGTSALKDAFLSLTSLKSLSLLGGFEYLDRATYDTILGLSKARSDFAYRLYEGEWLSALSATVFSESVFFTVDELLKASTKLDDVNGVPSYKLPYSSGNRRLIISLLNETDYACPHHDSNGSDKSLNFVVPSDLFELVFYSSYNPTTNSKYFAFSFDIADRKTSRLDFVFRSFRVIGNLSGETIRMKEGLSTLGISATGLSGIWGFEGHAGDELWKGDGGVDTTYDYARSGFAALKVSGNLELNCANTENDRFEIIGGQGGRGWDAKDGSWSCVSGNDPRRCGGNGADGAPGIVCHDCALLSSKIVVWGGRGGDGGAGSDGSLANGKGDESKDGGNGGNGGNGGAGIRYSGALTNSFNAAIHGGDAGAAGRGGNRNAHLDWYVVIPAHDGKPGTAGHNGAATEKF
jgi:Leucine-rich repeat (LRR) protein